MLLPPQSSSSLSSRPTDINVYSLLNVSSFNTLASHTLRTHRNPRTSPFVMLFIALLGTEVTLLHARLSLTLVPLTGVVLKADVQDEN
jgi:hypothetical protein